ncbi:hypothetical protein ABES80_10050 [Bacillus gobiensis]
MVELCKKVAGRCNYLDNGAKKDQIGAINWVTVQKRIRSVQLIG